MSFRLLQSTAFFWNLKVDAFGRLYAVLSINAAVVIFGLTFYGIRKILITRKTLESQEEKFKKISETKQMAYKAIIIFFRSVRYLPEHVLEDSKYSSPCLSLFLLHWKWNTMWDLSEGWFQYQLFQPRIPTACYCGILQCHLHHSSTHISSGYALEALENSKNISWRGQRWSDIFPTFRGHRSIEPFVPELQDSQVVLGICWNRSKSDSDIWYNPDGSGKQSLHWNGSRSVRFLWYALCSHEADRGFLRKFLDVVFPCSHVRQSRNRCCK